MDMLGQTFRPLANSLRYGPKKWKRDSAGVWVEQEMTPLDLLQAELAGDSDFFESTIAITEVDAEADPALKDYIGGRAIFPKRLPYPPGEAICQQSEDTWMAAYRDMEARQTITLPPDKPADDSTTGKYFKELKRGD